MADGWIMLHRRLADNELWNKRPFSQGQAWVDLLMLANWQDGAVVIGMQPIECKRGQSVRSLDTYAKRWGWSKSAVRRFFDLLQKLDMIRSENVTKTTRITICKYESYQDLRNDSETIVKRFRNDPETILAPNEQSNKEINIHTDIFFDPQVPKNGKAKAEYSEGFLRFWKAYPRPEKKAESYKVWKRDKLEHRADAIIEKLELFKRSKSWLEQGGRFIPHGSAWLNQKRYEDDVFSTPISRYQEIQ